MDIAALSMGLSQMKLAREVSTSVMKLAMDTAMDQSSEMTKMMESAVSPHIGGNIDIKL